jgi:hypothetical protein
MKADVIYAMMLNALETYYIHTFSMSAVINSELENVSVKLTKDEVIAAVPANTFSKQECRTW